MVFGLAVLIGLIPLDDHVRGEGVVEPLEMVVLHAPAAGRVEHVLPAGTLVSPAGDAESGRLLYDVRNNDLRFQLPRLKYMLAAKKKERQEKVATSPREVEAIDSQIAWYMSELGRVEQELDRLEGRPPLTGTWVDSDLDERKGIEVKAGDTLGMVADLENLYVRAVAGQEIAAVLIDEIYNQRNDAARRVEIRVKGRPDLELTGRIREIPLSGTLNLPSKALGYKAGGSVATAEDDQEGTKAAERFFEVRIDLDDHPDVRLLPGQRVVVRFSLSPKPLAAQWYRSLRQLVLRRFRL